MFLRIIKHLLPTGRAWTLTIDRYLRQFFDGLSSVGTDVKLFVDLAWLDIFPLTTRDVDAWESQFGLQAGTLEEEDRRTRLDAAWKALGGQSPRYIQDVLQRNGFNVFVHEWWNPLDEPAVGVKFCPTPRNPFNYLRPNYLGAEVANRGYPLVNIVFTTQPDYIVLCGEAVAQSGEPDALCGNYFTILDTPLDYVIPTDPEKWPYFLYIGGESFGTLSEIPESRRDEFEALLLKLSPTQLWLGVLVNYIEDGEVPIVPGDFMAISSNVVNATPEYKDFMAISSNVVNATPEYTGMLAVVSNVENATPEYSGFMAISSNVVNATPEYTGLFAASGDNS